MIKRRIILNIRRFLLPLIVGRSSNTSTIYHCCIQKTATQWFRMLFGDEIIRKKTGFRLYTPGENFITGEEDILKNLKYIPSGVIVSPFYISFDNFVQFVQDQSYRAFYITRDPRDIIISSYFSLKYSHANRHDYVNKNRKELELLSEHDGITKIIVNIASFISEIMYQWKQAENDNIKIYKFENVFGPDQVDQINEIFAHCRLHLSREEIESLCEIYSFDRISGRKQGTEDQKHHYRKGVSGDWKNYFSDDHKQTFINQTGELLIGLGYETDLNW